jgi:hypothetical protein
MCSAKVFVWVLAAVAVLTCLLAAPAAAGYISLEKQFPPPELTADFKEYVVYANGVKMRNLRLIGHHPPVELSETGESQQIDSFFDVYTEISMDSGLSYLPATGTLCPSQTDVVGSPSGVPGVDYDMEMTWLEISLSVGSLLTGVQIRESPTKASPGLFKAPPAAGPGGGYLIDSFFDIITEIFIDGGENWSPQDGVSTDGGQTWTMGENVPFRIYGVPEPGTITLLAAGGLFLAGCFCGRRLRLHAR